MAARRLGSLVSCAAVGHSWRWRGNEAPYRCNRCNQYDDAPHIVRAARRRAWLRAWSPVWPMVRKHSARIRVGYIRPITVCFSADVTWRFERVGELPGVTASLTLWRLRLAAGIGGGWQDEEGEDRGLLYVTAKFQTYGLRWIGCWFGHKPEVSSWSDAYVYCSRCDVEFARSVRPEAANS